ncbi:MAG: hypothetical protein WDA22_17540 [Bacteroidota bacterium]
MMTSDYISLFALVVAIISLLWQFYDHRQGLQEVITFNHKSSMATNSTKIQFNLVKIEITNKSRKEIWIKNVEHRVYFKSGFFSVIFFSEDYKFKLSPDEFMTHSVAIWNKEIEGILNYTGIVKTSFIVTTSSNKFEYPGLKTYPLFNTEIDLENTLKAARIFRDIYKSLDDKYIVMPNGYSVDFKT